MTKNKKKPQPYTTGQLNKLIDSLIHPLIKEDPGYIIMDTIFHALVEQDVSTTTRKFIKYNPPKLLQKLKDASQPRVPRRLIEFSAHATMRRGNTRGA